MVANFTFLTTTTTTTNINYNNNNDNTYCNAIEYNAIRTSYAKAKIDNTRQNCECRFCGDRDEMVYHIINECNKLAPKEDKTIMLG